MCVCMCVCQSAREREREGETDRQTDRQADRDSGSQRQRETRGIYYELNAAALINLSLWLLAANAFMLTQKQPAYIVNAPVMLKIVLQLSEFATLLLSLFTHQTAPCFVQTELSVGESGTCRSTKTDAKRGGTSALSTTLVPPTV